MEQNVAGRRKALLSLFQAGLSGGLPAVRLCALAADIHALSPYDTELLGNLANQLVSFAPCDPMVWALQAQSLRMLGHDKQALAACERALELDPTNREAMIAKCNVLLRMDQLEQAEALLREVECISPGIATQALCEFLFQQGKVEQAADVLAALPEAQANETGILALRCIDAISTGESAQLAELHDPNLLVQSDPAPESAQLNERLCDSILGHSELVADPQSTTTVGGGQAYLHQVLEPDLLDQVVALIQSHVGAYVEAHADHPYLRKLPDPLGLNCWAVCLDQTGYQEPHCHPQGRLSGVYYVDVARENTDQPGGAIEFWRPPANLAGSHHADTIRLQPENGMMLLFPSYYYHGTIPHSGCESRISIAFDVS